ncbi:MAG: hypothetical protein AAFP92_24950 [Bacteroidota bacterium]
MVIEIPVSPYVYKFIVSTYGDTPLYHLANSRKNTLRVAFQYFALSAEVVVPENRLPAKIIQLDIGDDINLKRAAALNRNLLTSGTFFEHEFNQALNQFIEFQEALARKWGLPETMWNKSQALQDFLDRYHITPYEYSWDSAYRALTRRNDRKLIYLRETLIRKYEFSSGENQHFRLAKLRYGKTPRIVFSCYSRSKEDIIERVDWIPRKYVAREIYLPYAEKVISIINNFLLKGYTIA